MLAQFLGGWIWKDHIQPTYSKEQAREIRKFHVTVV